MSKQNVRARPQPLRLRHEFKTGRKAGQTVHDVILDDPGWLMWMIDNIRGFELDDEAFKLLEQTDEYERTNR